MTPAAPRDGAHSRAPRDGAHSRAPRDGTRARVYEAEQQVRTLFDSAEAHDARTVRLQGSTVTLPIERRFASLESVQTYVDAVLALRWVRERYPAAARPVVVRRRNGGARAHYEPAAAVIAVPEPEHGRAWAMRELIVLHEIAHHLTTDGPSHGPTFVQTYLTLVGEIIGPEAELVLRVTMHENGAL